MNVVDAWRTVAVAFLPSPLSRVPWNSICSIGCKTKGFIFFSHVNRVVKPPCFTSSTSASSLGFLPPPPLLLHNPLLYQFVCSLLQRRKGNQLFLNMKFSTLSVPAFAAVSLGHVVGRSSGWAGERFAALEQRAPQCGPGIGSCGKGECCSDSGNCGTGEDFCQGSQCQLDYSDACDTL